MKNLLPALFLALFSSPLAAQDRLYWVGVAADGPGYTPFYYVEEKTGRLAGFDVDIARAVCRRLEMKCEIAGVPFDEIISQLEAGRLDIGCAGFSHTLERAGQTLFTDRYYRSVGFFLGPPGTFGDPAALIKGQRVAVKSGTREEDYLRRTYGDNIEAAPVKSLEDVIMAVNDRTADLGFIDGLTDYRYVKDEEEGLEVVIAGPPVDLGDGSSMALRAGDEDLRDRINQALADLRRSGEYDALHIKYFGFSTD
jgi:ABC-type amino acid transport substrate-binding protein